MYKGLLLLLMPLFFFSQTKEVIKLKYPVTDFTRTARSLQVIDVRKDKTIKDIVFRGKYYTFKFPTDDLSADIENWFLNGNRKRDKATNDIVMLVEDFSISNEVRNKEIFCVLDMKFSTFLKKDDSYHFLKRYDNMISLSTKEVGGIPNIFVENIQKVLQKLLFDTYRASPHNTAIPLASLTDYDGFLKSTYPAFSSAKLKDGIYTDYQSFFAQTPVAGYEVIKNKNGEVLKAVNSTEERIPARKIYIYVEGGNAWKNSQAGFLELQHDDSGYYVMANKYMLFPEEINVSSAYFLFGIAGGVVAAIQINNKFNQALEGEKYKTYIDYLNGEYSFTQ
ncbi:hypothetical protein [Kaistella palustris]|uniref:hypothetical protein n=1 Tax=Kaistella palustris TaxID=493376 RepID=UPI00041C0DF9|nr:hypothetical protein [Kaistella palustris]